MMKNITNMTTLPICWNPTHGLRPICRIFRNKQKSRGVVKKDVKKFIKMINKTSFSGVTINRKTHWKIAWEMLDTDGNIKTITATLPCTPSDNNWVKIEKGKLNRKYREAKVNVKY